MKLPRARSLKEGVKWQICLTFAGSGLVSLILVMCIGFYVVLREKTESSIHSAARLHRAALMDFVLAEVAMTMVPLHRAVVRLAKQANTGPDNWLPPRPAFIEPRRARLNSMAAWLYTELDDKVRIRSHGFDTKSGATDAAIPIRRLGVAVALKSDLETHASSLADCEGAVRFYFHELALGRYAALAQHVVTDRRGRRNITATTYEYFPETSLLRNAQPEPGLVTDCAGTFRELWTHENANFNNWSWSYRFTRELLVREVNETRLVLQGSMPLYSWDGAGIVGRIFAATNNYVFSDALNEVFAARRGLGWTDNGHLMLVMGNGRILAQTEFIASPSDPPPPEVVAELRLRRGSLLLEAVAAVEVASGVLCPDRVLSTSASGRLVDVAPFLAEAYGLPPMGDFRWCLIMTLPRKNIYEAIDEADLVAYVSALCVSFVCMCSLALLVLALLSGCRSKRKLEVAKFRLDMKKVNESVKEVKELNCPMSLISALNFFALQRLENHEDFRDKGQLVVLDSLDGKQGILKFQEDNLIAFISHQWLGIDFPDTDDNGQLHVMQDAIRTFVQSKCDGKGVYVWLDYISIPQCHGQVRSAAVSSLPVYASVADVFLIVAPTLPDADRQRVCNLETYLRRGWCRAEMLAKACGSGFKDMYICTDDREEGSNGGLSATIARSCSLSWALSNPEDKASSILQILDLNEISLKVFEGEFTVRGDQESLVKPMLGLYSLVLDDPTSEHMQQIYCHILENKEAFFPRTYMDEHGEELELFGYCVDLMESAARHSSEWDFQQLDGFETPASVQAPAVSK